MVITENIHSAKTHLSRLIEHALRGDEVIVAKAGKPLVCIVPFHDRSPSNRVPGSAQGMFTMAKDFDAPLTEEDLAAWEK